MLSAGIFPPFLKFIFKSGGKFINMIKKYLQEEVIKRLKHYPATGIIGARQTGKTTFAKQIVPLIDKDVIYLDLESMSDSPVQS